MDKKFFTFGDTNPNDPVMMVAQARVKEILVNLEASKGEHYATYVQLLSNGLLSSAITSNLIRSLVSFGAPREVILVVLAELKKLITINAIATQQFRMATPLPDPKDEAFSAEAWEMAQQLHKLTAIIRTDDDTARAKSETSAMNLVAAMDAAEAEGMSASMMTPSALKALKEALDAARGSPDVPTPDSLGG